MDVLVLYPSTVRFIQTSPLGEERFPLKAFFTPAGIIINAAGFTHTSVAIRDAMAIYKKPSIELHISNIYKREDFRHKSMLSDVVTGIICGLGSHGYILAIKAMHNFLNNGNR